MISVISGDRIFHRDGKTWNAETLMRTGVGFSMFGDKIYNWL